MRFSLQDLIATQKGWIDTDMGRLLQLQVMIRKHHHHLTCNKPLSRERSVMPLMEHHTIRITSERHGTDSLTFLHILPVAAWVLFSAMAGGTTFSSWNSVHFVTMVEGKGSSWKTHLYTKNFGYTVLIGYCDYHPVTKLPKIGCCDYSQMSF